MAFDVFFPRHAKSYDMRATPVMNGHGLLQEHSVENGLYNAIAWNNSMKTYPKPTETHLQKAEWNHEISTKWSSQLFSPMQKNLVSAKWLFQVEVRSTYEESGAISTLYIHTTERKCDSHMAFDVSCGQFMLRKEDKHLMKRKDKTVAAYSHVICFFFFWIFHLCCFFSKPKSSGFQKIRPKLWTMSSVFCWKNHAPQSLWHQYLV